MTNNYISKVLLFSIFFFLFYNTQAQIFVNQNANGSNDGSSWENAYTSLSSAINNSNEGNQIWVAMGTYKPAITSTPMNSFFEFPHDLVLYGGFLGNEVNSSERDPSNNETILSGDHDGNDVDDFFDNNRDENSLHVIFLSDTITNATIIDGFTIRNGNTLTTTDDLRRGGGILSYGAPIIRNCLFTQNYGYFGGAVYPRIGGADGVIIEDCTFIKNRANFGAGVYINAPNGTITNCEFTQNTCVTRGGAIYNNAEGSMSITDCNFNGNTAEQSRGGGIYNTSSPTNITNCTFNANTAPASSGGAVQSRSADDDPPIIVNITACTFSENNATWGGAVGNYDEHTTVNLTNCQFTENSSINVGGGLTNAFGSTTNILECNFTGNQSGTGGAIYSQNDSAFINIEKTIFEGNTAETGGAINISGDSDPLSMHLPSLTVASSQFSVNVVSQQGGAVNISNSNATFTNCLMDLNLNSATDGFGGAVSNNASDSMHIEMNFINSTIVNNLGMNGAGISQWTAGTGTANLLLQNTILMNDGDNYMIEDGTPTVTSVGGNLSSDASMNDYLTSTNDLTETDPLFVDASDLDYNLQNDSPCVDAGISANAPVTDILGNDRIDEVDMGAFENQKIVSTKDLEKEFGKLEILPNPVQENLNFIFENKWNGQITVRISDTKGAILFEFFEEKNTEKLNRVYDVRKLPSGIYFLQISNGELIVTKKFVK